MGLNTRKLTICARHGVDPKEIFKADLLWAKLRAADKKY